jgi:hypothetical protein
MRPLREFDAVVLGAGPVGMAAALKLSEHCRTALFTPRVPALSDPCSVEAVPASLLALLIEFGIHPHQLDVEQLHEVRLIAWEKKSFVESACPVSAHIGRPALDCALFDAVIACGRVSVIVSHDRSDLAKQLRQARTHHCRLIDASGRRAVSAQKYFRPARPWVARTFLVSRQEYPATSELRIAALPQGFSYRLGSSGQILIGVVGRGEPVTGSPVKLQQHLRDHGAGWILEGLPPLSEMTVGKVAVASLQWTSGEIGTRIGDAALARDTLSSQGLATGISQAMYAGAVSNEHQAMLLSARQEEQRLVHLSSLLHLMDHCRYRDFPAWKEYRGFVASHVCSAVVSPKVVLKNGCVQTEPLRQ